MARVTTCFNFPRQTEAELADMFWGGYFGSLVDKFCVQWMFNCTSKV